MTLSLRDGHAFWTLQAIGWTAFWLIYTLAELGTQPLHLALFLNGMFAATGFGASLLAWRQYRRVRHLSMTTLPVPILGSCAGAMVWYFADKLAFRLAGYIPWNAPWLQRNDPWNNQYFLLSLAGVLLAWSALYFGFVHARELDAERERALVLKSLARDAQLRALRYQLSPHFLFNVLNAISTLVTEGEASMANTMIARLGEFLRATLDDQEVEVTLQRELTLADKYLAIERVRFGDRLRASIEADQEVLDALVPPLLLQPLVENAVRHGVANRMTASTISISAEHRGDRLHLRVSDDGPGWGVEPPQMGIGLRNVRERLEYFFDRDFVFLLSARQGGGAELRVELPLRHAPASPSTRA